MADESEAVKSAARERGAFQPSSRCAATCRSMKTSCSGASIVRPSRRRLMKGIGSGDFI